MCIVVAKAIKYCDDTATGIHRQVQIMYNVIETGVSSTFV